MHNIHGYYINIELQFNYLKEANKPVIWTLHDCWPFTGHCAYFDYIGCDKWKMGCYDCPQKNKYPSSLFLDMSKKNYIEKKRIFNQIGNITIVTPSEWLAKLVKNSFLNKYDIRVINNGINLDIFKPTMSDFRVNYNIEDKFIILGVANIWDERKGLNYFKQLSDIIDDSIKIVLVGLSEEQKNNLPKNILGINKTNSIQELAQIYSSADVFVNPTLEDNFPTTNLEALSCGTPVITFNTGGSPECVDNSCGFVADKGNINDLLKLILEIKYNGKEIYTKHCRKRAEEKYSRDDRYLDYIDLYNKKNLLRND